MKSAPLEDISIVKEASDRFGSERIIVTIDLTECEDPVAYGKALKEAGAGELLLVNYGKLNRYNEYVKEVKKEVGLPIIVSSYSTDGQEIADLLKDTGAETISLYSLEQHDVMQLKQICAASGVPVNLYESAVPFSEFKKDDMGLVPCIVQDYKTKDVLMMAYMNEESFAKTLETGRMTYFSRSRNEL
jgi:phosphoribosyl-ATP pyrophosphohydrolase/phosphoribosyl-AMP cyclohydrolase